MDRFIFEKSGMFWWVYENIPESEDRRIVCVCVYKKGAVEATRTLNELWGANGKYSQSFRTASPTAIG